MTSTASRIVYRHRHHGCDGSVPLNLAERELITGRSLTQFDEETGLEFCVDCLADLPRDGYEALFHVCGEEPAPAPEPAAQAEEPEMPQPGPAVTVPRAKAGDVVRYHGRLTVYHGVWEVTVASRGRLRLYRPFEALEGVSPDDVTVVQTRGQRNRILRRLGKTAVR